MIRTGFRGSVATVQKRWIHRAPRLTNQEQLVQNGIEGLFSPAGFKLGWSDYQKFLTSKLSVLTIGTDFENMTPLQIVKRTAPKPEFSPIFHYASQSLNNHLFYAQLVSKSENKTEISSALKERIIKNFGSEEDFQSAILTEADLLNGQGWVFLVERSDKSLDIVPCMNDGSPYFYGRNQNLDLNGPIHLSDVENVNSLAEKIQGNEPDYSLPLLAINCWEYAYLEDYGVNGRTDYLEKLWSCIDWNVVDSRLFSVGKLNAFS